MDMQFEIGRGLEFTFDVGGSLQPPATSSGDTPFGNPITIAGTYGHFHEPIATPFGNPITIAGTYGYFNKPIATPFGIAAKTEEE